MRVTYNSEMVPGIIVRWYASLTEDLYGLGELKFCSKPTQQQANLSSFTDDITKSLRLWMAQQPVLKGIDTARAIAETASLSNRHAFASLVRPTLGPHAYIAQNIHQGAYESELSLSPPPLALRSSS